MPPSVASVIESRPTPREEPGRVHVTWFTDPINVWCWGCEPAIRRLQVRYATSVEIEIVMGGLFEDFTPIRDYWARMSGGRWQDSVRAFLEAVAAHHRMPMDVPQMMASVEDMTSTWPSCIAVKAAGLQGRTWEYPYLRRYREAMYLEGRDTITREVQVELASEIGLDVPAFVRALEDGTAQAAFQVDLERCRTTGVTGFPTFELRRGSATARLDGWQPWDAFDEALLEFAPDLRPTPMDPTSGNLLLVLRRLGRCATLEVAAVLGITDDEAEIMLEDLEVQGALSRREVGCGLFWEAAEVGRKGVDLEPEGAARD